MWPKFWTYFLWSGTIALLILPHTSMLSIFQNHGILTWVGDCHKKHSNKSAWSLFSCLVFCFDHPQFSCCGVLTILLFLFTTTLIFLTKSLSLSFNYFICFHQHQSLSNVHFGVVSYLCQRYFFFSFSFNLYELWWSCYIYWVPPNEENFVLWIKN